MTAKTAWDTFVNACNKVAHWCIWFGKLVIAIGIAYAAARMFQFGSFNLNGASIPVPKVQVDLLQLVYLAGAVYLISK